MESITYEQLERVVEKDAAFRRIQSLVPIGGAGSKVFPPTYPGERNTAPPRHVFEERRIGGKSVACVLLDSVQSQANRLEEALLHTSGIAFPHLMVDFSGQKVSLDVDSSKGVTFGKGVEFDLSDIGAITSLEAPHRVFDAIFRDSALDGQPFAKSKLHQNLLLAKPGAARAIFETDTNSLLFGTWNSTGEGGGLGAKFTRCLVSELIGINAVQGLRTSSRIDPLGIRATARIVGNVGDWAIAKNVKGEKNSRPSEINHSNIRPSVTEGGVSIDSALHTAVISCAGLRRLRFGSQNDAAPRALLAALGLVALVQQAAEGYCLRSRCDLNADGHAPFEVVQSDGTTRQFHLDLDAAIALFNNTVQAVKTAGLTWNPGARRLTPQPRLAQLVALSRAQGLQGAAEEEEAGGVGN